MNRFLSYEKKDTWIHELSGVTKLIFFLLWSLTSAMTYDTRVLLVMIAVSLVVLKMSRTQFRQVSFVFRAILVFMVLNVIAIFVISPYEGCRIYGSRTDLVRLWGSCWLTKEQLFYLFNIVIKYFTIIPAVFTFLITTDPSELAASMNRIGISYKLTYALAISLRYIPDIQDEYHRIKNAQEARGIEMSGKAKLKDRIVRTASILFPLLFTTMERIDTVSNAMELRGFGKKKKRTWYSARPLKRNDYLVLILTVLFCAVSLFITYRDGSRFWNPFQG